MMKIPLFVLVTILATLNLSQAQSQNGSSPDGHNHSPSFFGIPLPFQIPQFQIPQFQFPQLPFFREEEHAEGPPADAPADAAVSSEQQEDHQDRLFFSSSTLVTCNSTTQAGATCTSCTQALTCGSSNVGRLRFCHGFFPYCNLGRCSFFPGELCVNSTATG